MINAPIWDNEGMTETIYFIERRDPGEDEWRPVEESTLRLDGELDRLREDHYMDQVHRRPVPEYRMVRIRRKVYDR